MIDDVDGQRTQPGGRRGRPVAHVRHHPAFQLTIQQRAELLDAALVSQAGPGDRVEGGVPQPLVRIGVRVGDAVADLWPPVCLEDSEGAFGEFGRHEATLLAPERPGQEAALIMEAGVMAYLVELTEPRNVGIRTYPTPEVGPGDVLVRTLYSGISAGTELATYRGTNPYLEKRWDPELALFLPGETTFRYPVDVWGYSEVGVIEEVGEAVGPEVADLAPGDQVWGIWGHRSHAVLPADRLVGHLMPPGLDPVVGTFDRVGAVALNAVLAADARMAETVVVFGQGVIGLLATQLLISQGSRGAGRRHRISAARPRPDVRRDTAARYRRRPGPGRSRAHRWSRRRPSDRTDRRLSRAAPGHPGGRTRRHGRRGRLLSGPRHGLGPRRGVPPQSRHGRLLPDRFAAGHAAGALEPRASPPGGDHALRRRTVGSRCHWSAICCRRSRLRTRTR